VDHHPAANARAAETTQDLLSLGIRDRKRGNLRYVDSTRFDVLGMVEVSLAPGPARSRICLLLAFADNQLTLFAVPDHPKEGGLVAVYPGTSATTKPVLLVAHIDVVEARREDWERDPFKLDPFLHANLRTTCVATLLDGGHAANALPQRAGANVNCRIFPGHAIDEVRRELARVIGDPGVTVTALPPVRPSPPAPPLAEHIIGPMQKLADRYWPGIPVIPSMANGYTDATFLGAAGIPTYGIPGMWFDPDGNGAHGLNERMEVRSVYVGRDYMFDLVKAYAD
jgi:acetylornithine deacetylase/succinyl-diaminopimelate desuccinylase-like protein